MNRELLKSFYEIFKRNDNFTTYKNYYNALCNWLRDNTNEISMELLTKNRLDILLSLDINEYATEEIKGNGLLLGKEKDRIGTLKYKQIEVLLAIVSDTLWDLVTISSSVTCKKCNYGDLRYVRIDSNKLVLECRDCGCLMNLDGDKIAEKNIRCIPARKSDIPCEG